MALEYKKNNKSSRWRLYGGKKENPTAYDYRKELNWRLIRSNARNKNSLGGFSVVPKEVLKQGSYKDSLNRLKTIEFYKHNASSLNFNKKKSGSGWFGDREGHKSAAKKRNK